MALNIFSFEICNWKRVNLLLSFLQMFILQAMALNIKIDFNHRYITELVAADFRYSTFESVLIDGSVVTLGIKISTEEHLYMPDVYNMSFGPGNEVHQVDDQAKLKHQDYSKVFSTIIFEGLSFLNEYKNKYLGIDGSNTARAYMYYRCIQNNFKYLNSYFTIYGVNYYLRILRDGNRVYEQEDVLIIPKLITFGEHIKPAKLYNYFIFSIQ